MRSRTGGHGCPVLSGLRQPVGRLGDDTVEGRGRWVVARLQWMRGWACSCHTWWSGRVRRGLNARGSALRNCLGTLLRSGRAAVRVTRGVRRGCRPLRGRTRWPRAATVRRSTCRWRRGASPTPNGPTAANTNPTPWTKLDSAAVLAGSLGVPCEHRHRPGEASGSEADEGRPQPRRTWSADHSSPSHPDARWRRRTGRWRPGHPSRRVERGQRQHGWDADAGEDGERGRRPAVALSPASRRMAGYQPLRVGLRGTVRERVRERAPQLPRARYLAQWSGLPRSGRPSPSSSDDRSRRRSSRRAGPRRRREDAARRGPCRLGPAAWRAPRVELAGWRRRR